jgi:hypothetical protein
MSDQEDDGPFDKLPRAAEFLLHVPLYESFRFDKRKSNPFFEIEHFKGPLDCFCPGCERHSVFNRIGEPKYSELAHTHNYVFTIPMVCSRSQGHRILFIFRSHQGVLQKIGQYPSLADLATPDLEKYRPVLGKERFRELSRAIGLAAHGVGVGAFVYLRRIFESLVEEARASAAAEEGWNQAAYEAGRMDEKIALLRAYLPPFLVENRALYGIMSVGVHTLSEQECMAAFPAVRAGIELILDDRLERQLREEKLKAASASIGALKGALNKRDAT